MSVKGKHHLDHNGGSGFKTLSPVPGTSSDEATFLLNCSIFSSSDSVNTENASPEREQEREQSNGNGIGSGADMDADTQPGPGLPAAGITRAAGATGASLVVEMEDSDSDKTIEIEVPPAEIVVDVDVDVQVQVAVHTDTPKRRQKRQRQRQQSQQPQPQPQPQPQQPADSDDEVILVNSEISVIDIECSSDEECMRQKRVTRQSTKKKRLARTRARTRTRTRTPTADVVVVGEDVSAPRPMVLPSDDCVIVDTSPPLVSPLFQYRPTHRIPLFSVEYIDNIVDNPDAILRIPGRRGRGRGRGRRSRRRATPEAHSSVFSDEELRQYMIQSGYTADIFGTWNRIPYVRTGQAPELIAEQLYHEQRQFQLEALDLSEAHSASEVFDAETEDVEVYPSVPVQPLPAEETESSPPSANGALGKCPVCMDNLKNKTIASTFCGHVFCVSCIRAIVASSKENRKCPTCRGFLKGKGYHQIYFNP